MLNLIDLENKNDILNAYLLSLFPEHIKNLCKNYLSAYKDINEIRLRLGSYLSFTISDKNLVSAVKCSNEDIAYCIDKMTESSFARFEEMMKNGYVTLKYGFRAGVSGEVFVLNNKIKTLKRITSINIRIPRVIYTENKVLFDFLEKNNHNKSVLVISPPGVGKTTVLKNIALKLSSPPVSKRVCVVDTRHELCVWEHSALLDYFVGYPKADGISIASAYFNPEYVICDEIGDLSECEAISSLQHIGVPLIASAHAESFHDVILRKNLNILIGNGVFDAILRLYRDKGAVKSEIKTTKELFYLE